MRLMIFETHPVQYHAPVYQELQRICQTSGGGSIHVVYASGHSLSRHHDQGFQQAIHWDEPLLEGYPSTILNTERGVPFTGFRSLGGAGVEAMLENHRPDAVLLTGLSYQFDWAAYWGGWRRNIPVWLRAETQDEAFERPWWKSRLRSLFYRISYLPLRRAFAIGKANAAHYRRHGVSEDRLGVSRYCVSDRFQVDPAQRTRWRSEIRKNSGFAPETQVLLFVGKLQPKKNPTLLFDALEQLPAHVRRGYGVMFVGSGEMETELRRRAERLSDVVTRFCGFRSQSMLPAYYQAADLFVLPSRQMGETWGLVVNEALMSNLRVLVSKHVGCHSDFSELPGFRVFDGSAADLARCLLAPPPPSSVQANREFMRKYSVRAAASGIAQEMGCDLTPIDTPSVLSDGSPARCETQSILPSRA